MSFMYSKALVAVEPLVAAERSDDAVPFCSTINSV